MVLSVDYNTDTVLANKEMCLLSSLLLLPYHSFAMKPQNDIAQMKITERMHAVEIVPETQTELIGLFGRRKEDFGENQERIHGKCEFIPKSEDEDETF